MTLAIEHVIAVRGDPIADIARLADPVLVVATGRVTRAEPGAS